MIETLIQVTNLSGSTIYLDLYDDVSVNLNLSFAEIQDITSKNSGYSQTFKVPGTKKNNVFFNYMFNVNASTLSFDMQKSVPCSINYKGNTVLDGTLRLLNVFVYENEVEYEVNIQDEVGIFINAISNKLLTDLDYSDLNHVYNATNVQLSWDATYTGGTTTGGLLSGSILYPFQHIGYLYDSNGNVITSGSNASPVLELNGVTGSISNITTPMRTSAFRPSIQIYDMVERIFTQNGYNIESNFFSEEYFQRLYMPLLFNSETYFINATGGTDGSSQVGVTTLGSPLAWDFDTIPCGGDASYLDIYGDVELNVLNYNNGPTYPPGGWDLSSGKFYAWAGGTYEFSYSINLRVPNPGAPQRAQGTIFLSVNHAQTSPNIYGGASFLIDYDNNEIETGVISRTATITLSPGDYVSLVVLSLYDVNDCVDPIDSVVPFTVVEDTKVTITNAPNVVVGSTIDIKSQITPEYKQLDFLKGLITQFNLVFVKHPYKTDTYIMEPYEDYVGEGQLLDWTDKLDVSKPIKISPLTNLIGKGINYLYDEDSDGINVYTKTLNNNRNFGTLNFIPSGVTINDKPIEFKSFFAATPGNYLPAPNQTLPLICPHFYGTKDITVSGTTKTQLLPMKIKPRILHYCGKQPLSSTWYFYNEVSGTTIPYTYYPFLHHQDQIPSTTSSQAIDLNFGNSTSPQDDVAPSFTNNTAYDLYYAPMVEDLLSSDARMVTANFDLSIEDISNLEYKDIIFVKDAHYRINKINNFNLINNSTTQVELVKLLRIDYDYIPPTPTPTLTPTPTPTLTPTPTPTLTPTPTPTLTPTPTPTVTPTPEPPVDFSISGICSNGTSTVTVYDIIGGTGTLEINSSLQTSSGNTFTAGWVDIASSTVNYFTVPDGTWWVQVRDKSTPTNYKVKDIVLDCIVPGNCTCWSVYNPTTGSLSVDYYACDGSQPIEGVPGGSTTYLCVISGTTPTDVTEGGLVITQCSPIVSCTGTTECDNCGVFVPFSDITSDPKASGAEACGSIMFNPDPTVGNGTTFCNSTTLTNPSYGSLPTGTYYIHYNFQYVQVSITNGNNTATVTSACQACPTPTPTPTITPTPTVTNTPTPTPTPFQTDITGNISIIPEGDGACTGGEYGVVNITVVGTTLCDATKIVYLPSSVWSDFTFNQIFWVNDFFGGTAYYRKFQREGNGFTALPLLACSICPTPTPTPTLTPTPTPTLTPTPTPEPVYYNILACNDFSSGYSIAYPPGTFATNERCTATASGYPTRTVIIIGSTTTLPGGPLYSLTSQGATGCPATPTPTPTTTPTATPTLTPTPTPIPFQITAYTGTSATQACSNFTDPLYEPTILFYTGTLGIGTILYRNNNYTNPVVPTVYCLVDSSTIYVVGTPSPTDGYITSITSCPTPTPVPTATPIPSTYDVYERCDLTAVYYVDYSSGNLQNVTINGVCCSKIASNVDSDYINTNYSSATYFSTYTNVNCPCE